MTTGRWVRAFLRSRIGARCTLLRQRISDLATHTSSVSCRARQVSRRGNAAKLGFPRPTVGAVSHRQSFSPPASREHASGVRSILECVHLVSTLSCPRSLTRYIGSGLLAIHAISHSCAVFGVVARSVVVCEVLDFAISLHKNK